MNRLGWLGFLFFVALVILGFGTLLVKNKGESLFGAAHTLTVNFPSVQGLRTGNEVRVDGVIKGKVGEIELNDRPLRKGEGGVRAPSKTGVTVQVNLDEEIRLYEDYRILIEGASVLGGDMVSIHRGTKGVARDSDTIKDDLPGGLRPGLSEIGDLASDNRANLKDLIANLRELSQALRDGQGTIGKLLKSDELHQEAMGTLKGAREAITDARAEFKKVGDTVTEELTRLTNKIADKLDNAQGPAGAFLNDKKMTEKLDRILNNVEETSHKLKEITESVKKGDGALGKMVTDKEMGEQLKATIRNVEQVSESIRNIGEKLETGEGSVGRLLQDDELYEQAQRTLGDLDRFFSRAAHALVEVVGDYKDYSKTEMTISKLGVRIGLDEDKYFIASGVILGLNKNGKVQFSRQVDDDENDTVFKPEILVAYRAPFLLDGHLTIRGGYLEGQPGGGADFAWEDWGCFTYPVTFTFEARNAYHSVDRVGINEEISGPLLRSYVQIPLWIRQGNWLETLASTVKLTAGFNRIAKDPEWMVGLSAEWPDEDIRTLVGLIGAAR